MDFTSNLSSVKHMISNSEAKGGGDEAEDVIGALDLALNLSYQSKTCLIYLICDAPSHG